MNKLPILFLLLAFACGPDSTIDPAPVQSLYFPPIESSQWESIAPSELGWNVNEIPALNTFIELSDTRAVIILKDGKIAYEKYNGLTLTDQPFTQNSYWYWASAAKSVTSFLIGQAEGQGLLSLDDSASDYLGSGWTDLSAEDEEKITIRNQLTMTSGLDDSVVDPYCTDPECLIFKADPGTRWAYHNGPYTRLDGVIEAASSQDFDTFFNEHLRNEIGMDAFWSYSGYNHVLYSTPRSMARYGLLILNQGEWQEKDIMNNESYFMAMVNSSQSINPSYGYLWWLNGKSNYMVPGFQTVIQGSISPNAPDDMIAAMGKNGQLINIVPSLNMVVIRMGDNPDTSFVPYAFQDDLWSYINDLIGRN